MVLVEIGSHQGSEGKYSEASATYREALSVLVHGGHPMTIAHLKGVLGETYRSMGDFESAAHYFRAAVNDHAQLQMAIKVAYGRVILAETLLTLQRSREAEWELLAALPTIEEQKMVPEGFAAVALLKESVRRRKTDPNALRELREHLQASKYRVGLVPLVRWLSAAAIASRPAAERVQHEGRTAYRSAASSAPPA
jgi:tetratricopeptide (TPR) repeat protein